ncbi:MAG: hypothetical protein HOI58_10010, partial [Kordiimonadaceae bacterium]|nr:hypothetical protein [Kordiimonadaceae bacterium]
QWKYIAPSSESSRNRNEWVKTDKNIEGGFSSNEQLYNLENDAGELRNIAAEYPSIIITMRNKLNELRDKGFRE